MKNIAKLQDDTIISSIGGSDQTFILDFEQEDKEKRA